MDGRTVNYESSSARPRARDWIVLVAGVLVGALGTRWIWSVAPGQASSSATNHALPPALPAHSTGANDPATADASTSKCPSLGESFEVVVGRCVDGDTVELEDWRYPEVRYLGIDTPERGHSFYSEATQRNAEFVGGFSPSGGQPSQGARVRLEFESGAKRLKDKYGRLLAYVWRRRVDGSEVLVNEELLRSGLAYLCGSQESKYSTRLKDALHAAQVAKVALWANPPPSDEKVYVADDDLYFHRPVCGQFNAGKEVERFPDRNQAVESGRSPCSKCKP